MPRSAASPVLLDLIAGLASQSGRRAAVDLLAQRWGAESALLFVQDPVLHTLVPAPGMPQTLVGGPAWRAFLKRCGAAGRCTGEVDLPPGTVRPAMGLAGPRAAFVMIGGDADAAEIDVLARLLPLLEALLGVEHELLIAAGEAEQTREDAHRANLLSTALEAARSEASRLNSELHDEDRREDEFLAMLAHELRNPLAPLVNAVTVLQRGLPSDEVFTRLVALMGRQLGQIMHLVEDLMDVSRASHGRIDLKLEAVDLATVIASSVETTRPVFQARKHRLEVEVPGSPLIVDGDAVRLTQVFSNLLNNAAKYTEPGGFIAVTATQAAGQAVVEVSDDGVGIDPDMLPRVFALFTQASVSLDQSQGGLGIGLTLVRQLLELHGGSVSAKSPGRGQGSTFTVRLPLRQRG